MYDTINFKITQDEAGGVDFLEEIPCFLDNVGEHFYNGFPYITGNLKGLKVTANRHQVKIKDGSLCKFALGDNYQTLGRKDTQRAIELLSDTLHLPIDRAIVTRLDIAQNFILKHPTVIYLNHLGGLRHAKRIQEPTGLYYVLGGGRLCFYDKNKEQTSHRNPIPELYKGRNVLRYEQRYTERLASKLGISQLTGRVLYDEEFYISLLDQWRDSYKAINKINDVTLNFETMTKKKDMIKAGLITLAEQMGGQLEMIAHINEAQKRGALSRKQAFDLRKTIKDAYQVKDGLIVPSDVIQELDKKVDEAVRFYR